MERTDKTARTPSRARNAGIKEATGDYICFLDSDNYFDSEFIEHMIKPDKDVSFCDWEIVGLTDYKVDIYKIWDKKKSLLENYLQKTHLDHQCLLIKRELFSKIGVYDERLPRSQDCDLIVRLMLETNNWEYVTKKLFVFEKHEADQMKVVASIYGKTLWSLKLNIDIRWLAPHCSQDPIKLMALNKGIHDFCTLDVWKEDFEKSAFKPVAEHFQKAIKMELRESGRI